MSAVTGALHGLRVQPGTKYSCFSMRLLGPPFAVLTLAVWSGQPNDALAMPEKSPSWLHRRASPILLIKDRLRWEFTLGVGTTSSPGPQARAGECT